MIFPYQYLENFFSCYYSIIHYHIVWMYKKLFIQSPINGQLGCFQSFAIMDTAVDVLLCSLCTIVYMCQVQPWDTFSEEGRLGQMVNAFVILIETDKLSSTGYHTKLQSIISRNFNWHFFSPFTKSHLYFLFCELSVQIVCPLFY